VSAPSGRDLLGRGIAAVLRVGTLVTMAAIGIGYVTILLTGEKPGAQPLLDLVGDGGAPALLGLGLLGLTLIPAVALGVAAAGFRQRGEDRRVATALAVLGLLLASLVVAVALAPPG
jgi:uncharacterized membrane protein